MSEDSRSHSAPLRRDESIRVGRESLFAFEPGPVEGMKEYLESVSASWDRKLGRLKAMVEG